VPWPTMEVEMASSADRPASDAPQPEINLDALLASATSYATGGCMCVYGPKCMSGALGTVDAGGSCFTNAQCSAGTCDKESHLCEAGSTAAGGACMFDSSCGPNLHCDTYFQCSTKTGTNAVAGGTGGGGAASPVAAPTSAPASPVAAPTSAPAACATDTGGTCSVSSCASSRNANCVSSKCVCPANFCAESGACVASR
jgi:hypothetical protein